MKKIILISILLILSVTLLGCTSKEPVTAGDNTDMQTQGLTETQESGSQNNGATQTKTICKAQEIMESKAFAIGTDEIGFCKNQNFESLIEDIYLLVGKETYEKNPQKTGKDFYVDMKNDPNLRNYSNPAGMKVYLRINTAKQIDGFLPGNLPNPTNRDLIRCTLGQEAGENLNCQYCENFFMWKQNISESGEIGKDLIYVLNPTFDFSSATFQEATSSSAIDLENYFGDAKVYKISGFESDFGCIAKYSAR